MPDEGLRLSHALEAASVAAAQLRVPILALLTATVAVAVGPIFAIPCRLTELVETRIDGTAGAATVK